MVEADLYNPLVKGALREGWALYRIADGTPGRKPFDIGGSAPDGLAVGLEVKIVNKFPLQTEKLPWDLFEAHQKGWLRAYAISGAMALAALCERSTKVVRIYRVLRHDLIDEPTLKLPVGTLVYSQSIYTGWTGLHVVLGGRVG